MNMACNYEHSKAKTSIHLLILYRFVPYSKPMSIRPYVIAPQLNSNMEASI